MGRRDISGTTLEREFLDYMRNDPKFDTPMFVELFARRLDRDPKYYVSDVITIGPEDSKFVKPKSVTTIGLLMANKFIFEEMEIFGYVNITLSAGGNSDIDKKLSQAMQEGDIQPEQVGRYIDKCQYLYGGNLAHLTTPGISQNILSVPASTLALRKTKYKEHADLIASDDPEIPTIIGKELVDDALKSLSSKDDPALAMFNSGAVDAYNNYKVMFLMKGPVKDATGESPTGYRNVMSDYDAGVSKADMPAISNALVNSSYSSGVSTQDAGASSKRYNVIFQRVKLLDRGSDCKTPRTYKLFIAKNDVKSYLYRYVVVNGKNVMITESNMNQFAGTVVNLRSPLHCRAKDPCYCNICVGDRPYNIGVRNLGLTINAISGATQRAAMKVKHFAGVQLSTIGVDNLMKYVK